MTRDLPPSTDLQAPSRPRAAARLAVLVGAPLLVLAAGLAAAAYLMDTGPKASRQPRPREARLVEVQPVTLASHRVTVRAMGTVVPAREVSLRAEVSGRVVAVGPGLLPGARVAAGETLLDIDPADYRLAVRQRESEVARARAALQAELGNQAVARRELAMLGEDLGAEERALVLRAPQLTEVKAALAAAEASLAKARLDLERTALKAPFDALVRARSADLGARLDPGAAVATLVGTEAYWVEVSLPVADLGWIRIPSAPGEAGSAVQIRPATPGGEPRQGRVLRLLGDLESEGRMARLLVEVPEPLAPAGADPGLLLGAYVEVAIAGRTLEGVAAVDRERLQDGDALWLMDADGTLRRRAVTVAYRGPERVLVSAGLAPGERLVTTRIPAPVDGMPVRTAGDPAAPAAPGPRRGGAEEKD